MSKYPVCQIADGNTLFYVEADTPADAAFKGLEELGYFVAEPGTDEETDEEEDS